MEAARKIKDLKMEMEQVEKLARAEGWSEEMNMLPRHVIEAVLLKERRDKQQYIDMLAKMAEPGLAPLIESLNVFLKSFNMHSEKLLAEMENKDGH
jgi:hypothetical protein